jgi:hypothetical protein
MSLINQMLKDIDKRNAAGSSAAAAHHDLRGVIRPHFPWQNWAVGSVLMVLLIGVGFFVLRDSQVPAQPLPMASLPPVASPVTQPEVKVPELASNPEDVMVPVSMGVMAASALPTLPVLPAVSAIPASNQMAVPRLSSPSIARTSAQLGGVSKSPSTEQRTDDLYREAIEQLRVNHLLAGQNLLRQVLTDVPAHHAARQLLALSFLTHNELDASLQVMAQGVSMASDQADFLAFYASLLQRAARHDEAIQQYLLALRLTPDVANWLLGLAVSLQATQEKSSAFQAYQRAIDMGLSPVLAQFAQERLQQLKP